MASAARVVLPTESVVLISISSRKISRLRRRVASSSAAPHKRAPARRRIALRIQRLFYAVADRLIESWREPECPSRGRPLFLSLASALAP